MTGMRVEGLYTVYKILVCKLDPFSEGVSLNYNVAFVFDFLVKIFDAVGDKLNKIPDIILANAIYEIVIVVFGKSQFNAEYHVELSLCRFERLVVVAKIVLHALVAVVGREVIGKHERVNSCRGVHLNYLLGREVSAGAYGEGVRVKLGLIRIIG